jgi:DNA-binding transcriptional ArsR family regulator
VKSRVWFEAPRVRVIDVDGDRDLATIAPLLADDAARAILEATATEARSAEELAEHCGVSTPTIYRRLEELREANLLAERTEPDAGGHHYTVYRATLDTAVVELTEEGFDVRLTRRDRMADRFTKFVEDIP